MRILYLNLFELATLSATNENANYTISEVTDSTLKTKFMATTTSTVITAEWSSVYDMSSLAIGNHNISSMNLKLYNTSSLLLEENYTTSDLRFNEAVLNGMVYFTETANVNKAVLTCSAPSTLYIGRLDIGQYMQMPYFNVRPSNGFDSSQGRQKSRGGVSYRIPGTVLETFSCQFDANSITDYNTQVAFFKVVQKYSPYWVDRYENDTELPVMFMENTSDVEYDITPNGVLFDGFSLDLEECK